MDNTHEIQENQGPSIMQGWLTKKVQKKLGLALIPLSLAIIVLLATFDGTMVYDLPFLFLQLNTVFIGIISIVIALIAGRVYTRSRSTSAFMMGSGLLVFGLGSIVTGWVLPTGGGPNTAVTIYNSCACIGSILFLAGTVISMQGPARWRGRGDIRIIVAAYTGILVFVTFFSLAVVQGQTPLFFVQGVGPTALRQVILENTIVFLGIASVLCMCMYRRGRSEFFFWCSISLALISIGLLAVLIPSSFGSLVGWGGRSVQYLGFIMALYAVLLARRESKKKRLPLDMILANIFVDAEQNYRQLVETANDAIVTFDEDSGILLCNAAAERMFGYTRDEMIGSSFADLAPYERFVPVIRPGDEDLRTRDRTAYTSESREITCRQKDGTLLPVKLSLSRRWQNGRLISTGILHDLTGRRIAEDGRCRLAAIVAYSDDAIIGKDLDGIITSWNTGAERIYGYSAEEIIGKPVSLLLPPDQPDDTSLILERIRNNEPVVHYEAQRRRNDGRLIDVTVIASPIRDSQEGLIGISTISHDITLHKEVEAVSHASETRYRRLFEAAQDGILILDAETGQIVDVNPFLITMLGYSHEQFLGKKIWEIGLFKDIVANKDNFEELQRKESIRYENLPLQTADGRNIAVEFVSNVYIVDNKKVIQCNIRDITDRKKIEVALNATETRYRRLFETAQDGILILDAETGQIVEVNPFLIAFLGFSREEFLGKKIWEIGLFKDIVANKDNFDELQRKESIRYENLPLQTADGRNIAVEFVSNVYLVDHKKVIQCNIRDITDRKKIEVALNASETRYRRLFEAAQDGILILDAETGQIVDVNPFLITMLGYSHEQFLGKKIWEIGIFKDIVANKDNFKELQRQDHIRYEDLPLETSDGRSIAVEFVSNVYIVDHKKVIQCNIRDITDRKKIEVALNATETRYRRLFETAQDGILILDADTGQIVEVNPFLIAFLGFSREEFLGKKIWEIGLFKDIVANKDNFEELQRKESIRYENLPLQTADGRNIAVEFVSNVYIVDNKKVIQCNIRDITDRKKIEVALNATETRYRRLFETAQDGILILDAETGQIVEVNPFLIAFLGFSREEFLGKKIWEIGLFKDIVANKDNFEELQRKESIRYENLPLQTADGRNIAVEFVSNVYIVDNKKVIQCNIRDITERKKMTELIETSLAEKETLLKEIHHRVKNNLQIISSILNLQIRKIDDPKIIAVLKDSQTRVQAMALVHEHLYQGKDFSHVDLKNYITALGKGIFQMYNTGDKDIRFDLNIRHVYVDINTAIPLGLLSNELITNSLKHAFRDKKDGKVSITATEDPHALTFIVADNGIGISPDIRLENQTSLGLRLVNTLTNQLDGTATIDRSEGTKFTFTIPKPTGTEGKE